MFLIDMFLIKNNRYLVNINFICLYTFGPLSICFISGLYSSHLYLKRLIWMDCLYQALTIYSLT